MRKIVVAVAAAVLSSSASAAELKVRDCLEIMAGAAALDRYERVVGDRAVSIPYRLGAARFSIAQIISALRPISDGVERARIGLVGEIGNGKPIQPNSPEHAKLNESYQSILDKPCGVALPRIKIGDLNVGDDPGQNPIPPSVLSALAPIVDP